MAESEIDVGVCLRECRELLRGVPASVGEYAERLLSVVEAALNDPSGEDREQAIRYLELLQDHLDRSGAGFGLVGPPTEPPAIRAVRELRRRIQLDEYHRRRKATRIARATLAVSAIGATFAVLAYLAPQRSDPPSPPPPTPAKLVPAPAAPAAPLGPTRPPG